MCIEVKVEELDWKMSKKKKKSEEQEKLCKINKEGKIEMDRALNKKKKTL